MKSAKRILVLIIIFITNNLFGQTAYTKANLNLRNLPNSNSSILVVIPQVSLINIDNCENGWCYIRYSDFQGYVRESFITKYSKPLTTESKYREHSSSHIKYYTNSSGVRVQSPTFYNSVPEGASAQCYDGTYSFSRNRRGTCSHHGGVRRWL